MTRLEPPGVSGETRPARRLPFSLTGRSLVLLGAGLLWVGPAWIDRRALVMMAFWDLLVVAIIWFDLRNMASPRDLTASRAWGGPLTLGQPTTVAIEVHNRGNVTAEVRAIDYVSGVLRKELAEISLRVAAKGVETGTYQVQPRERGDTVAGVLALQWRSPWALAERDGLVALEQIVRVYPDVREGWRHSLFLVRSRQVALEKRRARHVGAGREFESLRDYRDGDELRDICWPATARRAKLVTKVYQPERSQTVWLLLDAGRLLRARLAGGTLLDRAVGSALTLAQVALASGDRVGLLAYGRRIQHRVAPARGAMHLRRLVESLAVVQGEAVEADHGSAAASLLSAQSRRAMIVWLTEVAETAGVPEVIEHTQHMARRHLVLFAVMRQPELGALADERPASAAAMYQVLAAQEVLERREALLHGLRQMGALVLEVSPGELAAGLVDQYLEVKERGLL